MKLKGLLLTAIVIVSGLTGAFSEFTLVDKLNYLAGQNFYVTQEYRQLKAPLSVESIVATSTEAAMQTCQNSFKWEHWNCPSSDFLLRLASKSALLDREDSYVTALTTAAVLYSITKNCSSGIVAGCGACPANPYKAPCSDNPNEAEQLYVKHFGIRFSADFNGKIAKHNYKAVTNLLQKSMNTQCLCTSSAANGLCAKDICLQVLKPFKEIAADIRQMYEEGVQLSNTFENSRIIWSNIPLDVLVYAKDSADFCEADVTRKWNGMRGRQCAISVNGEELTEEEHERCRYLCRQCGYTVISKNFIAERRCNCKFAFANWPFQVQCDVCLIVLNQHLCY